MKEEKQHTHTTHTHHLKVKIQAKEREGIYLESQVIIQNVNGVPCLSFDRLNKALIRRAKRSRFHPSIFQSSSDQKDQIT
jgi:hypothetical protein